MLKPNQSGGYENKHQEAANMPHYKYNILQAMSHNNIFLNSTYRIYKNNPKVLAWAQISQCSKAQM